ncbi:MAG: SCO family protein [Crocinitomicaceae bacterium]|nr:SCO family protein [Crocinitomicaceae bacterium]
MKSIILVIVVTIIGVTIFYFNTQPKGEQLPIYNPIDMNPEVVDSSLQRVGLGHTIGDFEFTNQEGKKISNHDLDNKVYVVEYFFTTCKSICPIMNNQMQRVQKKYAGNSEFKILSFTVDPETDDVKQLNKYAKDHHADNSQWWFLTGEKDKLYELARKSFFVLKPAEAENVGDAGSDFIHTNNFVLIDKKQRIRGYYDGTSRTSVDSLITDIEKLFDIRN